MSTDALKLKDKVVYKVLFSHSPFTLYISEYVSQTFIPKVENQIFSESPAAVHLTFNLSKKNEYYGLHTSRYLFVWKKTPNSKSVLLLDFLYNIFNWAFTNEIFKFYKGNNLVHYGISFPFLCQCPCIRSCFYGLCDDDMFIKLRFSWDHLLQEFYYDIELQMYIMLYHYTPTHPLTRAFFKIVKLPIHVCKIKTFSSAEDYYKSIFQFLLAFYEIRY